MPRDVVGAMSHGGGGREQRARALECRLLVDDADGTAERAVALGGAVVVAPHDRPMFRGAVLADPVGATFSISQLMAVPRSG